jgi:hypothetical protein
MRFLSARLISRPPRNGSLVVGRLSAQLGCSSVVSLLHEPERAVQVGCCGIIAGEQRAKKGRLVPGEGEAAQKLSADPTYRKAFPISRSNATGTRVVSSGRRGPASSRQDPPEAGPGLRQNVDEPPPARSCWGRIPGFPRGAIASRSGGRTPSEPRRFERERTQGTLRLRAAGLPGETGRLPGMQRRGRRPRPAGDLTGGVASSDQTSRTRLSPRRFERKRLRQASGS